ncbi:MAG: hypothetical protein RLY16_2959, partial [Bacteroidota bacterium]
MYKLFLTHLFFFFSIGLMAQEHVTETNLKIRSSQRLFRYEIGDEQHPVLVKQQSRNEYYCQKYFTDVPIFEFYNDVEIIDDVKILLNGSKRHNIKPKYEYYNTDGIFYSDVRVCNFTIPLYNHRSKAEVYIEKTVLDPKYFTTIFFQNQFETDIQEVKLIIPQWMEVEIRELNFIGYAITKQVENVNDATVYTYKMIQLPPFKEVASAPGPTYFAPHLLVLNKNAKTQAGQINYFNTLQDQYNWYRNLVSQIGNESITIKNQVIEIIKNAKSDEQKVKAIYQWVQDNIRYIAFENGIAGFRPEKAQDVLRKKYGDCKGMANLMTEMLRLIGLDARLCWLGTKYIAYDHSTPSLAVDNHMICAWMNNGRPVFLDATEKYSGLGYYAERIQGKQVVIENGENYLLETIPVSDASQNNSTETRILTIEGNSLKGQVNQIWKGESKEWLLVSLNNIKQDKQEKALQQYLSEGDVNFQITNLKIDNIDDYSSNLKLDYDLNWNKVISIFGNELFIDLDNRKYLDKYKLDTVNRRVPYWFHFKQSNVFETILVLPAGIIPSALPNDFQINRPSYNFSAKYVYSN